MNGNTGSKGRALAATLLCAALLMAASCAKPTIAQKAENVVDSMAKGNYKAATRDFDNAMTSTMSAETLAKLWTDLSRQAGAFKARTATREAKELGFETVFVTCRFDKLNLDLKVVFDNRQQVSGLWLVPSQMLPETKLP